VLDPFFFVCCRAKYRFRSLSSQTILFPPPLPATNDRLRRTQQRSSPLLRITSRLPTPPPLTFVDRPLFFSPFFSKNGCILARPFLLIPFSLLGDRSFFFAKLTGAFLPGAIRSFSFLSFLYKLELSSHSQAPPPPPPHFSLIRGSTSLLDPFRDDFPFPFPHQCRADFGLPGTARDFFFYLGTAAEGNLLPPCITHVPHFFSLFPLSLVRPSSPPHTPLRKTTLPYRIEMRRGSALLIVPNPIPPVFFLAVSVAIMQLVFFPM